MVVIIAKRVNVFGALMTKCLNLYPVLLQLSRRSGVRLTSAEFRDSNPGSSSTFSRTPPSSTWSSIFLSKLILFSRYFFEDWLSGNCVFPDSLWTKLKTKIFCTKLKMFFFPTSDFDLSLTPTKVKINLIGVLECNRAMSCLSLNFLSTTLSAPPNIPMFNCSKIRSFLSKIFHCVMWDGLTTSSFGRNGPCLNKTRAKLAETSTLLNYHLAVGGDSFVTLCK